MIPLQSQPIPKQLKRMIEWVGNSSRPLDGVSTSGAGSAQVWTTALYLLVRTGHFPTTLLGVQAVTITSLPNIFLSHSLQTVLGVCCPVFRLQLSATGAGFPNTSCSGTSLGRPGEILLLSNDRSVQMRTFSEFSAKLTPVTFAEFQHLTKTSLWGQEHFPAKEATETSNPYARCWCRNLFWGSFLFVHLASLPATCTSQLEGPRTLPILGKRKLPKGKMHKRFVTGSWSCQQPALLNRVELGFSKVSERVPG